MVACRELSARANESSIIASKFLISHLSFLVYLSFSSQVPSSTDIYSFLGFQQNKHPPFSIDLTGKLDQYFQICEIVYALGSAG